MSIKTSLFSFLILFSLAVSFSASAALFKITSSNTTFFNGSVCFSVGDIIDSSTVSTCQGSHINDDGDEFLFSNCYKSGSSLYCRGYTTASMHGVQVVPSCESGQEFNEQSGFCEDPAPYCDQSSTLNSIFAAEQSCAAEGGVFSYQCHNGNDFVSPSLETSCNEPPSACVMGFPNWPDCLGDYDPTSPITPPDGGFTSPDGSTDSTPDNGFDKPEPDAVTPNETTDTALLEAIQNLNRDSNQALGQISQDLNNNSADIKNKLTDINNSNNAIGQSIVDQMNQDYQIAEQNRLLQLQQNSTIANVGELVSDSVFSASNNIANQLSSEGSRLNDTLNGISEKICDPETDVRNCEGDHGLSYGDSSGFITEIADSANSASDMAYSGAVSAAQGFLNDSGTSEIENVLDNSIDNLLSKLPSSGSCVSFSLPTLSGPVDFTCEFSDKFKTLASFLLYIYTLFTLIDILLTGVTPVAGTKPYSSRGL